MLSDADDENSKSVGSFAYTAYVVKAIVARVIAFALALALSFRFGVELGAAALTVIRTVDRILTIKFIETLLCKHIVELCVPASSTRELMRRDANPKKRH